MKLCIVAAISLAAGVASADVTIVENRKAVTVDCAKDPELKLVGNHIKAKLTGTCKKVYIAGNHASVVGSVTTAYVAGNHNALTLDGVDDISVPGNHNSVTYKRPLAAKKTALSVLGKYNTVTQTK